MYLLDNSQIVFPHPNLANEQGLLAVGGDMRLERLELAYRNGIFPWFNPDEITLWWHPDPRFVIFPKKIKISKSMRSYFNQERFRVTFDTSLIDVLLGCKQVARKGNPGTWITTDFIEAYLEFQKAGYVHSVEVWNQKDELVGGLYGVSMGNVFYGESMFSKESNASKFALITVAKLLEKRDFAVIDCQMPNDHLMRMGGEFIKREEFLDILDKSNRLDTIMGDWSFMTEGISYPELIK